MIFIALDPKTLLAALPGGWVLPKGPNESDQEYGHRVMTLMEEDEDDCEVMLA